MVWFTRATGLPPKTSDAWLGLALDVRDVLAPEAAQETHWLVRLVVWATPGRIATNGMPWDIRKQRYIINVIIHIDVVFYSDY